MPFTTYQANKSLTELMAPGVYVALSSTAPALNGTGVTEPTGGSYARVSAPANSFAAAANGSISNSAALTFPTATADWVGGANITYGLIYDAATGGNLLGYGALTVAKNVLNGDTVTLAGGQLTVTLS